MILLVLDTSTTRACLGLRTPDGKVYGAQTPGDRRHGRDLIPALDELLGRAGVRARGLGLVSVGLGPGSYTGLRIGIMAARAMAYATGCSVLGLDSLEGIARNAPPDVLSVQVVSDAQRGDVYAAEFTRQAAGQPLATRTPSRIVPLAQWTAALPPGQFVIGPGLESPRIRSALPEGVLTGRSQDNLPLGEALIGLALDLWSEGRSMAPSALEPNYLRRSAAEDQWDVRSPRTS